MEWKDGTSYSRGDKERIPRFLELEVDGAIIVIHRIGHLESWYLTVHKLNIEEINLNTDNLDVAKTKGMKFVIDHITELGNMKNKLITVISNAK